MVILNRIRNTWTVQVDDLEFHDIHHALRLLLRHPLTPRGQEQSRLTEMAGQMWDAHCTESAQRRAGAKP